MQPATTSTAVIDPVELPGMMATLCSYESWFGPYHPQTIRLMTRLGIAFWQAGENHHARPLLERAVRDLARRLQGEDQLRQQALVALRELLMEQAQYERAGAIQRELLESQTRRLGANHPETRATRADLAAMLFARVSNEANREI